MCRCLEEGRGWGWSKNVQCWLKTRAKSENVKYKSINLVNKNIMRGQGCDKHSIYLQYTGAEKQHCETICGVFQPKPLR